MKLKRYIRKVYGILARAITYRKNFIYPNMYLFNMNKSHLVNVNKILFYFNEPEFMHLGDHLFFLPLIKTFIDSNYQIEVAPTKVMRPLFEKLGIPLIDENYDFNNYDLIISRAELFDKLIANKSLLVDVAKNLSMPICDQLLTQFSHYFNLREYIPYDFSILKSDRILEKFSLPKNKKFILFNFYCDSSSFLITDKKVKLLSDKVKDYAFNEQYKVLLVGSVSDRNNDNYEYEFDYIDIRGQTSVLDIFALALDGHSECYVGFDAFVMHVFSLVHKPSYVVFRGRLSAKQHDMLKKYHVNLFISDSYVKLLSSETI